MGPYTKRAKTERKLSTGLGRVRDVCYQTVEVMSAASVSQRSEGRLGPQPGVRGSSAYCGVETVRWVPFPGPEAWEEGHRESTYESPPTLGLGRNKHVQLES